MKTCTRCNGRLDTAAKAALSEVCTACGSASGDCRTLVLLPLFGLRTGNYDDYFALLKRMDHPLS